LIRVGYSAVEPVNEASFPLRSGVTFPVAVTL